MYIFLRKIYWAFKYNIFSFLKKVFIHRFKPYCIKHDDDAYFKLLKIRSNNVFMPKLKLILDNKYDLSIIIPIFNAEKYIKRCLDSIYNQKTKYTFEVICVDDCSHDNSINIIKSINYPNLKIISHITNKGPGAARNTGIENASGKYLMFVDSDDMISNICIESLADAAFKNNLDFVKGSHLENIKDIKHLKEQKIKKAKLGIKNEKIIYGVPWARIFKKDLFKNFSFLENCEFEDTINKMIVPLYVKKYAFTNSIVYFYESNPSSITNNIPGKDNNKNIDTFYVMYYLSSYFLENNIKFNYHNFLQQLYYYIPIRCKKLSNDTKKLLLISSKNLIINLESRADDLIDIKKLSYKDKKFRDIILKLDYNAFYA